MKKINTVYETYNYNQFKLLNNNRLVRQSHVTKIKKSMAV